MDKKDGVEQVSTATNDAHAADNIFVDASMATMNTLPTDVLLLIIVILQNSYVCNNMQFVKGGLCIVFVRVRRKQRDVYPLGLLGGSSGNGDRLVSRQWFNKI